MQPTCIPTAPQDLLPGDRFLWVDPTGTWTDTNWTVERVSEMGVVYARRAALSASVPFVSTTFQRIARGPADLRIPA